MTGEVFHNKNTARHKPPAIFIMLPKFYEANLKYLNGYDAF